MKYKNTGALICAMLFMLCSCGEDFLYKAPQGSADQDALTNAQGAEMLITTAYATFTAPDWGASIFNWTFGGIYGGDANKGSDSNDQAVLNSMETYALLNTNSYINEKWNWVYKGSKRVAWALQVLENVQDMDENLMNTRKAELYFLRALFYFEGVKVFGPYIPYLDESITDNDPKAYNDKDIYPNILADIDKAIAGLPDRPAELGRTYVWAAKALKAKILMQQGKMSDAKPILAEVLNDGNTASGKKYALADNLTDNWNSFTDNTSPESIFEIQFSSDGNDHGNIGMSLCYPHNSGPGGCCGFYQPSYDLANSFQVDNNGLPYLNGEYRTMPSVSVLQPDGGTVTLPDGKTIALSINNATVAVDPRLDFAIGRINIPYKDYGPALNWVRDYTNGGIFLPKKHVYTQAEADAGLARSGMSAGWAPGSAMNIQYLSVRDIMLLYAECLANDGQLSEAMDWVNTIRERAALPENIIRFDDGTPAANYKISTYPSSHAAFTDKNTCIKAIRMERKLELAMEGQRWFDLVRWGGDYMAAAITDYLNYEKQYIGKFNGVTPLSAARTMFPVPLTQIQTMGKDANGQDYLVQPAPWK
ncbi:MAG: RagB/SusD family nutrient uptake outer membrane protein [Candidatus Azobacteroides sp.]|nr:RagB/SusD family nutrient uptake outer membrane protein [Candidatus Azobacteroides sp.]